MDILVVQIQENIYFFGISTIGNSKILYYSILYMDGGDTVHLRSVSDVICTFNPHLCWTTL